MNIDIARCLNGTAGNYLHQNFPTKYDSFLQQKRLIVRL